MKLEFFVARRAKLAIAIGQSPGAAYGSGWKLTRHPWKVTAQYFQNSRGEFWERMRFFGPRVRVYIYDGGLDK